MIKHGTIEINAITQGGHTPSAIYHGTIKVWPTGAPITYVLTNAYIEYSTATSLWPNQDNYGILKGDFNKMQGGSVIETLTGQTMNITSVSSDRAIISGNKLYWNKTKYGSQAMSLQTISCTGNRFDCTASTIQFQVGANVRYEHHTEINEFDIDGHKTDFTINCSKVTYEVYAYGTRYYKWSSGNDAGATTVECPDLQLDVPNWMSFTYTAGIPIFNLTIAKNVLTYDRTGAVKVYDTVCTGSSTINITQTAWETLYVRPVPSYHNVDSAATSVTTTISANTDWTLTSSDTYISFSPTTGYGNNNVNITVSQNTGPVRNAYIRVASVNCTPSPNQISIHQDGQPTSGTVIFRNTSFDYTLSGNFICVDDERQEITYSIPFINTVSTASISVEFYSIGCVVQEMTINVNLGGSSGPSYIIFDDDIYLYKQGGSGTYYAYCYKELENGKTYSIVIPSF